MDTAQALSIRKILTQAIARGAADLHFSVGNRPTLRINGDLAGMEDQDIIDMAFMEQLVSWLLTPEQSKLLKQNREIIITHDFDKQLRFKINIFYQRNFLSATLRHIPWQVPVLDSLNLNPKVKALTNLQKGLVIVAGSFGSGRSTTVAAMLEEINLSRKEYIITIEDPIEYLYINKQSIIEQRQVGRDVRTMADAIKYFEEEDGDILYLEGMEDPKIIPQVLEIARAGALVITHVTAATAAETISRIIDSFTSLDQERIRDLLASALQAVVCQKVIPQMGGGVMVIQEILMVNDTVKSIILDGRTNQLASVIMNSAEDGMVSFDQILAKLVAERRISLVDALDNATDRKRLEKMIR